MITAGAFVTVLMVAGFVRALPRRPFTTTTTSTTTTTTTTTTEGPVVHSEGPVRGCRCCAMRACQRRITRRYLVMVASHDFRGLALNVDRLCERDLPAAERCLNKFRNRGCSHLFPFAFNLLGQFCPVSSALKSGIDCWSNGYQEGMKRCVTDFTDQWRESGSSCQSVQTLKTCSRGMMAEIPQCSAADTSFTVEYLRNNTLRFCPDQ